MADRPAVPPYRGRFAPSPTGRLHFGSLVTALASRVDALAHHGEWWVRIDDLDQTRCRPGLEDDILRSLEAFGMHWDGELRYQSRTSEAYAQALDQLQAQGKVYFCRCSRKTVREQARREGIEGPIYAGTCRDLGLDDAPGRAARLRTEDEPFGFTDRVFGTQTQRLASDIGDFVIRRADGYFAYQLAVVVDDALAGITHVVRGADLLASTPRQICLQRLLEMATPVYLHVPLVRDRNGRKLSKREAAQPVDEQRPLTSLLAAWRWLGQPMPDSDLALEEFWQWAPTAWQVERMRKLRDDTAPCSL
ncbi:tRNA glutamyl-Q(34) synthetase GluQRS [endosymbiont of unidentified scaly snail isolate Monju]|uniref:tRNA glutamyl-Q(34) synthetase GluQRS n=1 Tax=endosymbiont of unidentified scaly snail isolate Monju TaxID=1248727 RepID=UPI0003891EC7|nr:tRNA glutamyl-Q(34) synthetase GluQRS [endosymbiont of unidentified scaly snail isolate Monju]BAN69035.1 glutamyl-Q tRNA(Asp) synthetase [endosymbiont of unidentified scaly snail isolate Monju]